MTLHACPDCRCSDPVPQPSTSSAWARRGALEAARQAVNAARERREQDAAAASRLRRTTTTGSET